MENLAIDSLLRWKKLIEQHFSLHHSIISSWVVGRICIMSLALKGLMWQVSLDTGMSDFFRLQYLRPVLRRWELCSETLRTRLAVYGERRKEHERLSVLHYYSQDAMAGWRPHLLWKSIGGNGTWHKLSVTSRLCEPLFPCFVGRSFFYFMKRMSSVLYA